MHQLMLVPRAITSPRRSSQSATVSGVGTAPAGTWCGGWSCGSAIAVSSGRSGRSRIPSAASTGASSQGWSGRIGRPGSSEAHQALAAPPPRTGTRAGSSPWSVKPVAQATRHEAKLPRSVCQ